MMKVRLSIYTGFMLFVTMFALNQNSFGIEVTFTSDNPIVQNALNGVLINDYADAFTKFQETLSDSFAVSFAITDLIGSTKIKNIEIGLGVSTGITDRFEVGDGFFDVEELTRGVGVGVHLHVGLDGGLLSQALKDWDFIVRFFYLPSLDVYNALSVESFAVGLKGRWHVVKGTQFVEAPAGLKSLFAWGGLTLSGGLDYAHVSVKYEDQDIDSYDLSNDLGQPATVNITDAKLELNSNAFFVSLEALTNIDFLWILTFYLSPGAVFNFSRFDIDGEVRGLFTTQGVSNASGGVTVTGKEGGNVVVPYLRGGLEINISFLKLTAQGQVAYGNERYYGGGLGLRFEF